MQDNTFDINDILNVYDVFEEIRDRVIEKNGGQTQTLDEKYDAYMVAAGREAVFNRYFLGSIAKVEVYPTMAGVMEIDNIKTFYDKYVPTVPDYFSRDDFRDYFSRQLREAYFKCKDEAIKEAGFDNA